MLRYNNFGTEFHVTLRLPTFDGAQMTLANSVESLRDSALLLEKQANANETLFISHHSLAQKLVPYLDSTLWNCLPKEEVDNLE